MMRFLLLVALIFGQNSIASTKLTTEYQCGVPDLSHQDVVKIIEKVREDNPELSSKKGSAEISVRRELCGYVYIEVPKPGARRFEPILVNINLDGVIIEYLEGFSATSAVNCPQIMGKKNKEAVKYTASKLESFLKINREIYDDLTIDPINAKSKVIELLCTYSLYKEFRDDGRLVQNVYTFDVFGNLISSSVIRH